MRQQQASERAALTEALAKEKERLQAEAKAGAERAKALQVQAAAQARARVALFERSASNIQSTWRGFAVRGRGGRRWIALRNQLRLQKFHRLEAKWTAAALTIQSVWRMFDARMAVEEMHAASTRLQCWYRGCLDRMVVAYMLRMRYWERAAMRIQSWWRGQLDQEMEVERVLDYEQLGLAALVIQRSWRGCLGRRRAEWCAGNRKLARRRFLKAAAALEEEEEAQREILEAAELAAMARVRSGQGQEQAQQEHLVKGAQRPVEAAEHMEELQVRAEDSGVL